MVQAGYTSTWHYAACGTIMDPLGELTEVRLIPAFPEQPQARVGKSKKKRSHCCGLTNDMKCTLVYDHSTTYEFDVVYSGKGAAREALISTHPLPFLQASRGMLEGIRLAIKVERLPATDWKWPTVGKDEEQVLLSFKSPFLPRLYGSTETSLGGQNVFLLVVQAAYQTVDKYITNLHGVTPTEAKLMYLWKGLSEALVGICDEWLVRDHSHADLHTMNIGFVTSEAAWTEAPRNSKVGVLFIDVAESKRVPSKNSNEASKSRKLWREQFPTFLKSACDALQQAGGFWADPVAAVVRGLLGPLQIILDDEDGGVIGPAIHGLCRFVEQDLLARFAALRQNDTLPSPLTSLKTWLTTCGLDAMKPGCAASCSSKWRPDRAAVPPPACLDKPSRTNQTRQLEEPPKAKRGRTCSPPPPPSRALPEQPATVDDPKPTDETVDAPEWYMPWKEDLVAAVDVCASEQRWQQFRGHHLPTSQSSTRLPFQERYATKNFPRFEPRVSQVASDAVNRLIHSMHRALQYKFELLGIQGNARCRDPLQFASRGQMVGRWIDYLIDACGDPSGIPMALQRYWIHPEAAHQVMMLELEILQLDKNEVHARGLKRGADMPRFTMEPEEQWFVASEAVHAFELSMCSYDELPNSSNELQTYLDGKLAEMHKSRQQ